MITEIKRKDLDADMAIFPDIKIDVVSDPWGNSKMYIETAVQIDNYLSRIVKYYEFKNKINYIILSKFVDSLKKDVAGVKRVFNPEMYKDNEHCQIYKIIE